MNWFYARFYFIRRTDLNIYRVNVTLEITFSARPQFSPFFSNFFFSFSTSLAREYFQVYFVQRVIHWFVIIYFAGVAKHSEGEQNGSVTKKKEMLWDERGKVSAVITPCRTDWEKNKSLPKKKTQRYRVSKFQWHVNWVTLSRENEWLWQFLLSSLNLSPCWCPMNAILGNL